MYRATSMSIGLPKAVLDAVVCIYTVIFNAVWLQTHIHQVHDPGHVTLQSPSSHIARGTGDQTTLRTERAQIISFVRT